MRKEKNTRIHTHKHKHKHANADSGGEMKKRKGQASPQVVGELLAADDAGDDGALMHADAALQIHGARDAQDATGELDDVDERLRSLVAVHLAQATHAHVRVACTAREGVW